MRARALIPVLAGALVAALPAAAPAAVYEGKIKGVPDSTLDFTIAKVDGKRRVTEAEWTGVPTECGGVPQDTSGSSGFTNDSRVVKGRFDARLHAGTTQNRLKGRLGKHGSASGIFRATYGMMTVCDTGKLEWKAEKAQR